MIYSKHNYAQRPDSKTFGLVIRLHPLTFRHTVIFSMAWENNGSFVCLSYPFSVFVRCWGFQMWGAERRLSTGVRHVTWGRLQVWLSCRLPDTVRPRDLPRYTRLWFYLPSFYKQPSTKVWTSLRWRDLLFPSPNSSFEKNQALCHFCLCRQVSSLHQPPRLPDSQPNSMLLWITNVYQEIVMWLLLLLLLLQIINYPFLR